MKGIMNALFANLISGSFFERKGRKKFSSPEA